jgi:heparin binding hemagglutinin HbhA
VIIMAVSLPTAADVRKIRDNARKTAVERVEIVRTPALAVLGAADFAVSTVTKAVTDARARATAQAEEAQARLNDAQTRIAELPQKLNADELKKAVEEIRTQAEKSYDEFAARGELALGKIRKQPQVKQALTTIESVTDKFDARVDSLVDDAHDAAEKALSSVSTQTRSTGEKVAQAAQRFTGQASSNITKATKEASETVAELGADAASEVAEAGAEVAKETRSTTRRAANRTAPKAAATKTTAAKAPAARTRKTTAK